MGDFKSRRNFGGSSERKEMFEAVCDECGKECQVPFKPTGNKPIFCNDCFRKQEGGDRKAGFTERTMYMAHCDDCGKKCEVPFKPVPGKEVFCSDCFTKRGETKSTGGDYSKLQSRLDILNSKLDKVLKLLDRKVKRGELLDSEQEVDSLESEEIA